MRGAHVIVGSLNGRTAGTEPHMHATAAQLLTGNSSCTVTSYEGHSHATVTHCADVKQWNKFTEHLDKRHLKV